jgi:hypothetical protein
VITAAMARYREMETISVIKNRIVLVIYRLKGTGKSDS